MLCAQLSDVGRTQLDPAFNAQLTDVVVFKFKIELGSTNFRTLRINTPENGFGNLNTTTGQRNGHWFLSMVEPVGSAREQAIAIPAFVNVVPTPGAGAIFSVLLAVPRRRK